MLKDSFDRTIEYLRLSVTDRCDLRCTYCLPEHWRDFEEPDHWLSFGDLARIVAAFVGLGVRRVRLTGGEPLTRKGLPDLAAQLSRIPGLTDLSLSTNATRLARFAAPLKAAGISRVNVSLDSLDPERFRAITQGRLDKVLEGLRVARREGLAPIKINMVVMRDTNDGEVEAMVDFCAENGFTLRLIETMPVGDTGRRASSRYMALDEIRARLERRYTLLPSVMGGGGPARYVQVAGTEVRIGFITPMSQHFCATCNRVRLGPDGMLYLCLGHEDRVDLGALIRAGVTDAELSDAVRAAIRSKPERHEFRERPGTVIRFMAATGG